MPIAEMESSARARTDRDSMDMNDIDNVVKKKKKKGMREEGAGRRKRVLQ